MDEVLRYHKMVEEKEAELAAAEKRCRCMKTEVNRLDLQCRIAMAEAKAATAIHARAQADGLNTQVQELAISMSIEQLARIAPSIDKSIAVTTALTSIQEYHMGERDRMLKMHEARLHELLDYGLGGADKVDDMQTELNDLELALSASLQEQSMIEEKLQQQRRTTAALGREYDTKRESAEQLTQKVKQVGERTIHAKANLAGLRNEVNRMERELSSPAPPPPAELALPPVAEPRRPTYGTGNPRVVVHPPNGYAPSQAAAPVRAPKPGLAPMHPVTKK